MDRSEPAHAEELGNATAILTVGLDRHGGERGLDVSRSGLPDFYRLNIHRHERDLCFWAFDLLHHNRCLTRRPGLGAAITRCCWLQCKRVRDYRRSLLSSDKT